MLVVNAFKQTLLSKTKLKEEEYGESFFIEFVFGDSLGIFVFNLKIGRLFPVSCSLLKKAPSLDPVLCRNLR